MGMVNDMTDAEHLLENAIHNIKDKKPKEYFFEREGNIIASKQSGIKLDDAYSMAQYVLFTYANCRKQDIIGDIIEATKDYDIPYVSKDDIFQILDKYL